VVLAPPVTISQWDIRELQLAKGAIAAGVRLLLEAWGPVPEQSVQVFLAGAFGNYINQGNAQRIGLLRFPLESIRAVAIPPYWARKWLCSTFHTRSLLTVAFSENHTHLTQ
jgi:uncharacterized 2Fe-2S/4Fe-4S cluster protein (DUF4445 family)